MMNTKSIKNNAAILISLVLLSACSGKNPFAIEKKLDMPGERIPIIEKSKDLELRSDASAAPSTPEKTSLKEYNGFYQDFHHIQNLDWNQNLNKLHSIAFMGNSTLINPSNIVVLDEKIYAMSSDGIVYCYNIAGDNIWQNDLFREFEKKSYFSFMSEKFIGGALKIEGNILYISTGSAHLGAFNIHTGEKIFLINLTSPSRSIPVVHDDLVIVQTVDNNIHAFNKDDGTGIWAFSGMPAEVNALALNEPLIINEKLIAKLSTDDLIALDVQTGMEIWETPMSKYGAIGKAKTNFTDMQKIAFHDSYIYASSEDGKLSKVSIETGEIVWSKELMVNSSIWIAGDLMYAVTTENRLIAASIQDGILIADYSLKTSDDDKDFEAFYGSPVMINSKISVIRDDGLMLSVSLDDGSIATNAVSEHIYSEPKLVNGKLLLLSNDGQIDLY
ncbi:MAG: PQQ-binding-like beta-propeller repeat protein [Alphaproteobacteria bacterium]